MGDNVKSIYFRNVALSLITSNPIAKYSLRLLTDKCKTCNLSVLEQILKNILANEEMDKCDRCNRIYKYYRPGINLFIKHNSKFISDSFLSFSKLSDDYNIPSYARSMNSLLRGVLEYGIRKPLISSVPLSAVLEITKNCNLDCSYCYINKVGGHKELTTDQWVNIIDKLSDAGVASLSFSGGEPLLRKDFFTLLEYANAKEMSTSLATNGTMIDQKIAKKLYSTGLKYIDISIFSSNEEKNDFHRRKGSFKKAIDAVRYCKDSGLCVGLAITMTSIVKDEVEDFLKLAKSINCDVCSFFNYIPMSNEEDKLSLSNNQKEKLISEMIIKRREYDPYFKEITILQAPEVARLHYAMQTGESYELKQIGFTKLNKSEHLLEYVGGCFAGRFIIAITTSGDILPCPFFRVKLGNILIDDILNVWRENQTLMSLRNRENLKGKCGSCKYKVLCGGCRARAFSQSGDVLESDFTCLA